MKIKRTGAYEYNVQFHQDPSALVVPKAAEARLVHGTDIGEFIRGHKDAFDFCLRAKVPRSNNLIMEWQELGVDMQLPNIVRYFVSTSGGSLVKVAPPVKGAKIGTWKRKAGVSDAEYERVLAENGAASNPQGKAWGKVDDGHIYTKSNGVVLHLDIDGTPHDERIHTKSKSKHTERRTGIAKGWLVTDASDMDNFDWSLVNYDYYIAEAEKLVNPLLT